MTTAHGLCIGPEHATNVHRDCPRTWTGSDGVQRVCGCTEPSCPCGQANEREG